MDASRLTPAVIQTIEDPTQQPVISLVSFWELTIKESLGKLEIPGLVAGLYNEWISDENAELLDVKWQHVKQLKNLPPIHRDPFDRMLVAQALIEDLTIITCDENIRRYPGIKTLW